jgi:uncharacterized membrane protein YccF (DUF307 family)
MSTTAQMDYVYHPRGGALGCIVSLLWFFFIGWWAGLIAIGLAWLLNITIIGLPLGLPILNSIPMIIGLQQPTRVITSTNQGGQVNIDSHGLNQINIILRTIYFLLIGWWISLVWLLVAYCFSATILLLPIGLLMFHYAPFLTTLKRY